MERGHHLRHRRQPDQRGLPDVERGYHLRRHRQPDQRGLPDPHRQRDSIPERSLWKQQLLDQSGYHRPGRPRYALSPGRTLQFGQSLHRRHADSHAGNYTQGASGALNIDIGGTGSGQYGRLTVSGAATLGGTISASLFNNFTPAAGDTFQDVIDFASKSGDFTTQNLSLGNNLSLQEQFDPSTNPVRLNLVVNQYQPPTITADPTNQIVNAGQTATFTAAASGNPTPTVQWQVSTNGGQTFVDVPGAISTTLSFTTTAAQNGSEYRAVFTNAAGTATTLAATLTVDYAPAVTSNPSNLTVNAGETATFTAAASDGYPTPTTVYWQVSNDGGHTFNPVPGAAGTTLSFSATAAQNGNEYEAVFSNTTGLSATTTAATLTVNYAPTVTSNPSNLTVNAGETATFTAAASDGYPTPTTVYWQVSNDGGHTFNPVPGAAGTTLSFSATAAQNGNEYEAVFSNTTGLSATTTAATLTVNYAPTVTNNPSNLTANAGETATFTAAASDGYPTPTTVYWQVSNDGGHTFNPVPGATGTTLSFSATAAQNGNEYEAVFSNTTGLSATTAAATLTVKVTAATTTTVTSSPSSSVFGQAVTFTVLVKAAPPATGTPTGSVTLLDGTITLGTATLSTSGKATLTTRAIPALPAGQTSKITAIYSGDGKYATSGSTASVLVGQDTTTTTVISSATANTSVFGQSVTFTAIVKAVAPGSGVPTGTVTFFDGSTSLVTTTLNSSGKATFTTRGLALGPHTITASYSGDDNFIASVTATTAALTQTVNQAATKTTVASSTNPSRFGQPVTFTATVRAVAPGSGVPTGTVAFFDGLTSLGTAQLYGSGQATISISTLSVGPHSITASYAGDLNFNASVTATTGALTQTVNQAATKTTVTSSANPSGSGKPVTFTATVKAVAPGIGIPTGTVTFSINGTPQSPAVPLTMTNGVDQATFTTAPLLAGTYTITAVYDGDSNFTTSTSAAFSQRVK